MNEYDETTGDYYHVRGHRSGRGRSCVVERTILRRRARGSECGGGLDGDSAVQGLRSGRTASVDQGRLRAGYQQEPVIPRLPEIRHDRK